jgi:hypothetical protein
VRGCLKDDGNEGVSPLVRWFVGSLFEAGKGMLIIVEASFVL